MAFRAVVLDRDGVLNKELGTFVTRPEDLALTPGAAAAVKRLNDAGLTVVVATNQSGIGRGLYAEADLERIHARLLADLAAGGARLDGVYHCPHGPDDGCDCRKPLPGLIVRAAADHGFDPRDAVLVGDAARDLESARAVGAATVLVRTGKGPATAAAIAAGETPAPDHIAADLPAAVDWILARCAC